MNIKTFIEKAIEGGWKNEELHIAKGAFEDGYFFGGQAHWKFKPNAVSSLIQRISIESILLDPLAWQAVGKCEGWKTDDEDWGCEDSDNESNMPYQMKMHRFIDALCDGKDLSASLEDATV